MIGDKFSPNYRERPFQTFGPEVPYVGHVHIHIHVPIGVIFQEESSNLKLLHFDLLLCVGQTLKLPLPLPTHTGLVSILVGPLSALPLSLLVHHSPQRRLRCRAPATCLLITTARTHRCLPALASGIAARRYRDVVDIHIHSWDCLNRFP